MIVGMNFYTINYCRNFLTTPIPMLSFNYSITKASNKMSKWNWSLIVSQVGMAFWNANADRVNENEAKADNFFKRITVLAANQQYDEWKSMVTYMLAMNKIYDDGLVRELWLLSRRTAEEVHNDKNGQKSSFEHFQKLRAFCRKFC